MSNDTAIRAQALDVHYSFIVQAPAGSGKTELLTLRYLALLAQANSPEEIVAITFTRKAANEMRIRILETLQQATNVTTPPCTPHLIKRLELARAALARNEQAQWNLLECPHRLRIQTIDSFCARLTRQMPLISHLGAQPKILDDPNALYQQAAQAVLEGLETNMPWADALANLLLHLDNDQQKVKTLFCEMLAKRDQWLPYIASSSKHHALRPMLEKSLQQVNIDLLTQLTACFPTHYFTELFDLIHFAAKQLQCAQASTLISICDNLTLEGLHLGSKPSTADISHTKNYWLAIAELLLTQEGEWRKKITKEQGFPAPSSAKAAAEKNQYTVMKQRMQEFLLQLETNEQLKNYLQATRTLPPSEYNAKQWEVLLSLLELLPILVAQLQLFFQEIAAVDYTEITLSALFSLGDHQAPSDLALSLDYQIQHLLVDEFQDTSTTQFRLLELVTAGWQQGDGRTLFLVGDPMQSIYRFRKAEVSLFVQAQKFGVGNLRLTPLTLTMNFRSTQPVVAWINQVFSTLMPADTDIVSSAIPFTASYANPDNVQPGTVITHSLVNADDQQEARLIHELIKQAWQENPQARIVILVRARSHLLDILPHLQNQHIPLRAVEIQTLAQRTHIQDLLALTCALLHPAHRIAWLAILRAPWCGLTLADLHRLFGNDHNKTILECLQTITDYSALSAHAKIVLPRVIAILKQALAERRRTVLATWIRGVWFALGGPACLQKAEDLDDTTQFFKLLTNIQNGNDIQDFVELERQLTKLYSVPRPGETNYVDVMTIHKAKGLEFDTVILPQLHRPMPNDDHQLLLYMERPTLMGNTHLLLAPIKASSDDQDAIYEYVRLEEKQRIYYETKRLLYVAATRAKQTLHLIGSLQPSTQADEIVRPPIKKSFLAQLWPFFTNELIAPAVHDAEIVITTPAPTTPQLRRLVDSWQLPALPSNTVLNFAATSSGPSIHRSAYTFSPPLAQAIGTVVHRFLNQISQDGLAVWQPHDLTKMAPQITALLNKLAVPATKIDFCCGQVLQALQLTLDDPKGRWILQTHQQAASEFSFTTNLNNEYQKIIIDRTFIDEQNIRWIIDYKTVASSNAEITEVVEKEFRTYRPQLEEYAKIMQTYDPEHAVRLGLYFPLLQAWREWEL